MNLSDLSAQLGSCHYPEQMQCVECGILGAGFYPGTNGYVGTPSHDGIMLLGRDFGTKKYYEPLCGMPPRDETAPTWQRTRDVYLPVLTGIPVWCTNYIMGVRKDGSSVGNVKERITPSDWQRFEGDCWKFLHAQVLVQHPRIVVVLGGDNRDDLTATARLGTATQSDRPHRFESDGRQHAARIVFGEHPHSLIPRVRQEAARTDAERWTQLYHSTPLCKCRTGA
ncbi:MAG TPA: hypothetical protein VGG85_02485 [Terracidiphilus sp.]|jgi:hypothetical protein